MRMLLALAALVAAFLLIAYAQQARAEVVIGNDGGGVINNYIAKYRKLNAQRERIVITGPCESACTLLLGIIPRDRVCAMPGATLGFHSAWVWPSGEYYREGTRFMWSHYPADVRAMIRQRGWDGLSAHRAIISIEARKVYRACG